jgi:predicted phage terminase large subunit-like protein
LYQHVPNSIPKGINKADLIKSATFIPATIYGNKELLKKDNAYLGNLLAQDPVNRARFLDGNWKVRSKGGDIFHADWFTPEIERAALPADLKLVRAWDLAATEPHKGNLDPDWTAGVLLGKAKNGMYYVLEARRTRGTPHHVAKFVTNTAHFDGRHVKIVAEQEIGSAGKFVMAEFTRMLDGFNFKGVPSTGNKTQRAGPAANQAEAGNMKVVKGQWTDMFLAEIPYTGADTGHDDIGDALSLAHSQLAPPQKKGGIIALSSPRPIPKETKRRMSPFGYQWDSPPNQVIDTTPPKGPLTVFDV